MTDQELIIECAKLDGFSVVPTGNGTYPFALKAPSGTVGVGWTTEASAWSHMPPYLTSRDAIVPVIEKCCKTWQAQDDFMGALNEELAASEHSSMGDIQWLTILSTSCQLCIALLKATGKHK